MQPPKPLRLLVATGAVVLALVAVGCTIQNVNIRPPQYEGDSTHIFGEVKNDTDGYAGRVQMGVTGSLFDARGIVIATPFFRVCPNMVKPHDAIPFSASYRGTSPVANYELHLEIIPIAPVPDASLSISGVSVERDEHDSVHVLGMVTNTGSERYEDITVCAAFYDSSGKVDGFLINYPPDIDPGQTTSFDAVSLFESEPSSGAVSYRLWAQPREAGGWLDRAPVSTDKLPLE